MKALPGILVGLAVGAVVGLLLAPESGKKTRKHLSKGISKESESFFSDLQDQLKSGLDNIRSQYDDFVETSAQKSKEVVSEAKRKAKF